jgi:hypothetical protein
MLRILTINEKKEWFQIIESMETYDVYHLPLYHKLAEERGEGKAMLFVYSEDKYTIALPLLIRKIDRSPQENNDGLEWFDATSTYGYIGPLSSSFSISGEIIKRFHDELMEAFINLRLVSVFSRLHPLLSNAMLLSDFGICKKIGETISIDLTTPEADQWSAYRRNHRSDIQKLSSLGITFFMDTKWEHYNEFISMYQETMQRVHASKFYTFNDLYFHGLKRGFGERLFLCFCEYQNKFISGGLVTICNGIIEFHLAATPNEFLHMAPIKLIFDSVRRWGKSNGARIMHLGGGVGSVQDSLFHFKAGFSKIRNDFLTWQFIVQPAVYDLLVNEKLRNNVSSSDRDSNSFYFPEYRTKPII